MHYQKMDQNEFIELQDIQYKKTEVLIYNSEKFIREETISEAFGENMNYHDRVFIKWKRLTDKGNNPYTQNNVIEYSYTDLSGWYKSRTVPWTKVDMPDIEQWYQGIITQQTRNNKIDQVTDHSID